jgi:hypothetical protein
MNHNQIITSVYIWILVVMILSSTPFILFGTPVDASEPTESQAAPASPEATPSEPTEQKNLPPELTDEEAKERDLRRQLKSLSDHVVERIRDEGILADPEHDYIDTHEMFELKIDALFGGGFDSNLFRERFPLRDDFDYPAIQPTEEKKTPLLNGDLSLHLTWQLPPSIPIWQRSQITLGGNVLYRHIMKEDNVVTAEQLWRWGFDFDWYFKRIANKVDFSIGDVLRKFRAPHAASIFDDSGLDGVPEQYDFRRNKLNFQFGSANLVFNLYYKWKRSQIEPGEILPANQTTDFGPGPFAFKLLFGMIFNTYNSSNKADWDAYQKAVANFSITSSVLKVNKLFFRFSGDYWERHYDMYQARNLDGSVDGSNPLLLERRAKANLDFYFGEGLLFPFLQYHELKTIGAHYELYLNFDSHEKYYNYLWHRWWVNANLTKPNFSMEVKYQFDYKSFTERQVIGSSDTRLDLFHSIHAVLKWFIPIGLFIDLDYSFSYASSNADFTYLNFDKHYIYLECTYLFKQRFGSWY